MRHSILAMALLGWAFIAISWTPGMSQDRAPPQKGADESDFRGVTDEQFVEKAVLINLTEIALGNHAADRAKRADIQQFGKQLKNDHLAAQHQLETIAAKRRYTIPTKLDAKHQSVVDQLTALVGDEFDKAYMTEMIKGHKRAVALYKHEADNGKDADVKAYATQTLPAVRLHLQKAERIWNDYFVSLR
jgi:putative membrane protein